MERRVWEESGKVCRKFLGNEKKRGKLNRKFSGANFIVQCLGV
jgi:hypothetical protein